MNELLKKLQGLSAAEEFLEFFGLAYDPAVVHVNRLHILKRFHQYLRTTPGLDTLEAAAMQAAYSELLARAYRDFVHSNAAREKVFKVFQDQDGSQVSLDRLQSSLPSRRTGTHESPAGRQTPHCRERQDAESGRKAGG